MLTYACFLYRGPFEVVFKTTSNIHPKYQLACEIFDAQYLRNPDGALLFQPHNVKPPLHWLIFYFPLFHSPTQLLSILSPLLTTFTSCFASLFFILLPSLHPDAAEESKAEEATPADAAAEATESKDD